MRSQLTLWLCCPLPIRVQLSLSIPRPPWMAVRRATGGSRENMSRLPTASIRVSLRWKLWEGTVLSLGRIGYPQVRSGLYIVAITSRLEGCASASYFPMYPLARLGPIERTNRYWKTTRISRQSRSTTPTSTKPRNVEATHQTRKMLQRRRGWF